MSERNNKLLKAVASRLVQARKQTGLSAKQMASHMGMTYGGYQKNECGENFPGLVTLLRLAGDFDISIDWLLANKGPMHHNTKTKREIELEQELEKAKQAADELKNHLDEMKNQVDDANNRSMELKNQLDEAKKEIEEAGKETEKARKETEEVKLCLAGEREKQEKAAEEREKAFDMRPDVRELLDYMEKDNVFYYQLMLNFHEIKQGKKKNGDYPRIPPPPGQSQEIN